MLSIGANRKLAKNVGVFNLPAIFTCPNSTSVCRSVCYATKKYLTSKVLKFRFSNLISSFEEDFVDKISGQIKACMLRKVRVHESGDFYSQEYLNKWVKIAKNNPNTKFLAYTRSFQLDFRRIPDNFVIYFSIDRETKECPPYFHRSYLLLPDERNPFPSWKVCKRRKRHHYCGKSCNYCWDNLGNVVFPKH